MTYTLPKLKYAFNELEPHYDALTVEIHYTKHHQTYVTNLNNLLVKAPIEFQKMSLEELLVNLDKLPDDVKTGIRNNGGGHYCHNLFWAQFTAHPKSISGDILKLIERDFGSFDQFKESFSNLAKTNFGSGWTWLVLDQSNTLKVINTSGHNTPLELGYKPLMVIDIWEHAYYLKFQNRRPEWIESFWNILDWDYINETLKGYLR